LYKEPQVLELTRACRSHMLIFIAFLTYLVYRIRQKNSSKCERTKKRSSVEHILSFEESLKERISLFYVT